jgi:hypothetical protein
VQVRRLTCGTLGRVHGVGFFRLQYVHKDPLCRLRATTENGQHNKRANCQALQRLAPRIYLSYKLLDFRYLYA